MVFVYRSPTVGRCENFRLYSRVNLAPNKLDQPRRNWIIARPRPGCGDVYYSHVAILVRRSGGIITIRQFPPQFLNLDTQGCYEFSNQARNEQESTE